MNFSAVEGKWESGLVRCFICTNIWAVVFPAGDPGEEIMTCSSCCSQDSDFVDPEDVK